VRYADLDAERKGPQGLSRLAFWRDAKAAAVRAQPFRLELVAAGTEGTRVRVLGGDGAVDRSETAQRILGLLFEQLR